MITGYNTKITFNGKELPFERNPMNLQINTNYVTAAGYVIRFYKKDSIGFCCSSGWCPNMKSVELDTCWADDGVPYGIGDEWVDKLKIVDKLDCEIPNPPIGYKWKDGYIQYRVPVKGDYHLSVTDRDTVICYSADNFIEKAFYRRFIVEPKEKYPKFKIPAPIYCSCEQCFSFLHKSF